MATETLEAAFASTQKILADVTPEQLDLSTPCASWKVRDLVNHFVSVAYWSAETVNTGTSPERAEIDDAGTDMSASYAEGVKRSVAAFGTPGAQERVVTLPFGAEMPAPANATNADKLAAFLGRSC